MKSSMILMTALLLLFLYPGCKENAALQSSSGTTGTLILKMTDAPAAYDHVYIVVDSILAHIESNDSVNGWIPINRIKATYDLLELVNGEDTIIGRTDLLAGYYTQIRLMIGDGSNVVVDGISYPLKTPSGQQSGVKLNVDVIIEPDIAYVLTLDFDANRSIVKTGNPHDPKYILKPVIRTHATGSTGIISGGVTPASARPVVWGYTATDTVSTSADTSGRFKLIYLMPAVYDVLIMPTDTLHRDTLISNVAVYPGKVTDLGTIPLKLK